ncbi:hypothetical protein EMPS_01080 [Entomortierella parvispora]|uniref:SET domain-containing protein n=1 Tax=Entomortierella parvispora TaxID=205924 RepID=A0A9P3H2B6_9FUNG|nr:hypothetical protein EMPS_01080 [Entomortierella parvispora]
MATNPNFQEFLQDGDYLEEEWQRVYDLRFCTILVPLPPHLASRARSTAVKDDQQVEGTPEVGEEHGSDEAHVHDRHLPLTDMSTEATEADLQILPPSPEPNSPSPTHSHLTDLPLQTRARKAGATKRCQLTKSKGARSASSASSSLQPSSLSLDTDQSRESSETPPHQSQEPPADDDGYMTNVTTSKVTVELSQPSSSTNTAELEGEDELDHILVPVSACEGLLPMSPPESRSTPAKRKRWELDPSQGLLHPCQPSSPPKRVTLSSPTSPGGITTVGRTPSSLLKPRSYEPSTTRSSSYMSQSSFGGATSSSSDGCLFKSTVPLSLEESVSDGCVWSNGDWRGLKKVYLEMNGDTQSEEGLGLIADRFLLEDAARNGGESRWDRPKTMTRCIALQMVERERQRQALVYPIKLPPTPYTPLLSPLQAHSARRQVRTTASPAGLQRSRNSSQPYPTHLLRDKATKSIDSRASSSTTMTSVDSDNAEDRAFTGAAQLIAEHRTQRNSRLKKQDPNQGSQLKSIVKARFAEGLDSVRQLLGFWKEVEQGNSETKEDVLVPLVPLHRVRSVVDAFECAFMNPPLSPIYSSRMEHVNAVCEREGYPIVVENSPTLGNHAIASRDVPQGEGLLRVIPYAAEAFDNFKKRMCQVCLLYYNRGAYSFRCQDCDQVYFCSSACKDLAMDPQMGCHLKICRAFRKLATWNSDRHTKSIIKLLLQVLMNHWRERQGFLTAYQNRQLLLRKAEEGKEQGLDREREERAAEGVATELSAMALDSEAEGTITQAAIGQNTQDNSFKDDQPYPILSPGHSPSPSEQQQENDGRDRIQEPVENNFYDFLLLQSHFEDWDEEDNKDWNKQSQIVLSLLDLAGLTEVAMGRDEPLRPLTSADIKRMISALESNAFGMFDRSKTKPVCFGRAVFPMASYFNHSCDCNATAVQADGSMEVITGLDVLGLVDSEAADKAGREKAGLPLTSLSNQATPSTSTSSLSSSLPPDTPPVATTVASTGDTMGDKDEEGDVVPELVVDPYESRVGEFRMMTFFATKDISKGEDITISYIDTEMPLHARRLALLSDYHFHCCCERCLREEKLGPSGSGTGASPISTPSSTPSSPSSKKMADKGPSKKDVKKGKRHQARIAKK